MSHRALSKDFERREVSDSHLLPLTHLPTSLLRERKEEEGESWRVKRKREDRNDNEDEDGEKEGGEE